MSDRSDRMMSGEREREDDPNVDGSNLICEEDADVGSSGGRRWKYESLRAGASVSGSI